jgi:hypothetical protein
VVAWSALLLACTFNTALAQSGTGDKADAPKTSTKAKQMPFRGKIVKVDSEKKTITLGGKERDRTFYVTEQSRVRRDGQPIKLEEVRIGDSVGGLARANGADKWDVVTLNVGEKPDKPSTKEVPKGEEAE